jgi:hypothetical protein
MSARSLFRLALVVGLTPAFVACGGDRDVDEPATLPGSEATTGEAVRVTDVALGRAIDTQGRIADNADTDDFAPGDTIYASVSTSGSASGSRLTARWTFEDGQVVDESSQTISPSGPATTEFHISNPGGFPAGSYRVEIQLDGRTVETKEFNIR